MLTRVAAVHYKQRMSRLLWLWVCSTIGCASMSATWAPVPK
jgi:hypothetical protein